MNPAMMLFPTRRRLNKRRKLQKATRNPKHSNQKHNISLPAASTLTEKKKKKKRKQNPNRGYLLHNNSCIECPSLHTLVTLYVTFYFNIIFVWPWFGRSQNINSTKSTLIHLRRSWSKLPYMAVPYSWFHGHRGFGSSRWDTNVGCEVSPDV